MRQKNYTKPECQLGTIFIICSLVGACATTDKPPSLSDLKSRFWKDTYYLSVKESPTSIKCQINTNYDSPKQIPVTYEGTDATHIFNSEEDLEKIRMLQQQCFDGSPF